jgi:predicted porin
MEIQRMKKSLLAVAAIGAFASAAQAQSSVTVYGILDVAYIGANQRASNNTPATAAPAGTSLTTQTQSSGIASNGESTSRLGFKGNEDLGGGLSAFFTVEIGLQPNNTQAFDNGNSQNRQTFVGLKKNGIGSFAVGNQYTLVHNAVGATDPGQANNMMGNVIYDKAAGAPAVTQTTNANPPVGGNQNLNAQGNNTSYTVRMSNMLTASSDNFAGFQANAFLVAGSNAVPNNTTNQSAGAAAAGRTGGETQNTGFGLGLNYNWQKLLVTANYQTFTQLSPYNAGNFNGAYTAGGPVANGAGGASLSGTNAVDRQQYYAATYDFGILKAYAQFVSRVVADANNSGNFTSRSAQQIGVRSYITPTIEAWASTGTGKYTVGSVGNTTLVAIPAGAQGSSAASFGGFQLGSNYWLSKRSNLYAIYGQQRQSNQSYGTALTTGPTAYNSNNYGVGVRHTF